MPNKGGRGNRKPRHLKVLEGNPGKAPLGAPVQLPPGMPDPPAWLTGRGLDYFHRLGEPLARAGLLTPSDGPAFADLCRCLARLDEAEAIVQAEGMVVTSPQGRKMHPALKAAKEYRQLALALAKEFGLTPRARGSLDVAPPEVRDELVEILDG